MPDQKTKAPQAHRCGEPGCSTWVCDSNPWCLTHRFIVLSRLAVEQEANRA